MVWMIGWKVPSLNLGSAYSEKSLTSAALYWKKKEYQLEHKYQTSFFNYFASMLRNKIDREVPLLKLFYILTFF